MEGQQVHNLADLIGDAARQHPDRIALIGPFGERTWAELDAAASAGVGELADLQPGGPVLLALPTGLELAAAMIAVLRAGMVAVPLDPDHGDIAGVAARLGCRAVITDADLEADLVVGSSRIRAWWGRASQSGAAPAVGADEDIALLARAGRSGPPVMLSHRALAAAGRAIAAAPAVSLTAADRVLQVLPLFHVVGLVTAFLPAALAGAAVVIPDFADPATRVESALAAVRKHRVSFLPAEPTLYRQLERIDGFERTLASVRLMTSGSSSLDPADFAAIRSATGQAVREGYGISEAASAITSTLMAATARPGSSGLPYPGVELRILNHLAFDDDPDAAPLDEPDPDGADPGDAAGSADAESPSIMDRVTDLVDGVNDLVDTADPGGGLGPIVIRGATLFSGYWPDGVDGPDQDGWFVTGDIGYLDDAGELHLVDRASETMTVDGFTVYPREIEDVLVRHPLVADAAVVGMPGRVGETVVATIVPKPATRPTADDVSDFVAQILPSFKRPTDYRLVPVLPRTEVGRLDRAAVRAEFAADRGIDLPVGHLREAEGNRDRLRPSAVRRLRARIGGRARDDSDDDLF